jgi:5'-deoxynucleotidase YfbR-like HD superfamily hydrolase
MIKADLQHEVLEPPYERTFVDGGSPLTNIVVGIAGLSERLTSEKRHFCEHADGRPENVAEHTLMLVKLVPYVVRYVNARRAEADRLDGGLAMELAANHDDPEAIVNDTCTIAISSADRAEKAKREAGAAMQLTRMFFEIPEYGEGLQANSDKTKPEARLVSLLDKISSTLIQYPSRCAPLLRVYTPQQIRDYIFSAKEERMTNEFPEFPEVLGALTELHADLDQKFLTPVENRYLLLSS